MWHLEHICVLLARPTFFFRKTDIEWNSFDCILILELQLDIPNIIDFLCPSYEMSNKILCSIFSVLWMDMIRKNQKSTKIYSIEIYMKLFMVFWFNSNHSISFTKPFAPLKYLKWWYHCNSVWCMFCNRILDVACLPFVCYLGMGYTFTHVLHIHNISTVW